ncbi:phage major capsid protein [Agromyces sp. CCNWLW203]|uniref:phage major capsid protein n=1 Tax=Agromyces sp. CCNWLW203 TaxID=3112842 RepID=UPI002F968970
MSQFPTFEQLIAQKRGQLNAKIALQNQYATELDELRGKEGPSSEAVEALRSKKTGLEAELHTLRADLAAFEREAEADKKATADAETRTPTGAGYTNPRALDDVDAPDVRAGDWIDVDTGKRAALRSGESFRAHPLARRTAADEQTIAQYGGIGQLVRAITTTSGSAVVPTEWAADLIDRARNASAIGQAGATLVPMDAKTVNIGRLTGDPSPAFRTEGSAITPSDVVLDNVTLTAKTQSALLLGSLEWFQDADNADEIVADAIAKAMAQQLDLTGLYGGIIAGAGSINLPTPPNPRGILAALNATLAGNVLGGAANGTAQTPATYYNELLDLVFKIRDGNEEPTAVIWNTKLRRQYAGANDTTGQPLRIPGELEDIPRFTSNQIPSYTQGTMASRATDAFAGDFSKLLIGQRLGFTLQVLTERYADNGQIGVVAHWRGDIQPARSTAFAVYRSLQGAV